MKNREDNHPAVEQTTPGASDGSTKTTRIIGVGASSGGLAAFMELFSGFAPKVDLGFSFVLVQHLAPDHRSLLAEIVQRHTHMQVVEAEHGMRVEPNHVYTIPTNYDLAIHAGVLRLTEPLQTRGHRMPIDFFFRSLAAEQQERAVAIVLSGTGSDGTEGIRAIHAQGGTVLVQSPDSTEFSAMPRNAIATGLVHYQMPPSRMAICLIDITMSESGAVQEPRTRVGPDPRELREIFALLQERTGHDFSLYKPGAILRRMERRMAGHQIFSIDKYIEYQKRNPKEVDLLLQDLLIGVTRFFRDLPAFHALEEHVIPKVLAGRRPGSTIRIWTPGCSTGEEVYSIAILFQEQIQHLDYRIFLQIFATDIHKRAIAVARAGVYPATIAADMSAERLTRFFTSEGDGSHYRIRQVVRDLVVFSEHDVTRDPPFSKIDLICCRNLMIYFSAELQKKLIPLFRYALKPGGILFLGNSESVGEFSKLFTSLDRKSKLYQRNDIFHDMALIRQSRAVPVKEPGWTANTTVSTIDLPVREWTERAVSQEVDLAAALVHDNGDIIYLWGRTSEYLDTATHLAGTSNILILVRDALLRTRLQSALQIAVATREITRSTGLSRENNGQVAMVDLAVRPILLDASTPSMYAVIFKAASLPIATNEEQSLSTIADQIPESPTTILEEEKLRIKDQYLEKLLEQLSDVKQELHSYIEEMSSINEEYQSTNEELETSKEELQSINEELTTVNSELQAKMSELTHYGHGVISARAGTGIGVIFIDTNLDILRFTPPIGKIIHVIASDIGRPLHHLATTLIDYVGLSKDAQTVLDTQTVISREVATADGAFYTMAIKPTLSLDNFVDGVVITFVDISETRRVKDALALADNLHRWSTVLRDAHDAIAVHDLDGRILAWNPSAVRLYGWTEAEALNLTMADLTPSPLRAASPLGPPALPRVIADGVVQTQRLTKDGRVLSVLVTSSALMDEDGQRYAIATTERTYRSEAEGASA